MEIIYPKAKEKLNALGYTLKDGDEVLLNLAADRAVCSVCNDIARNEIPDKLVSVTTDIAVGEFLSVKRTFAPQDIAELDISPVVKQIAVGDTSTAFAVDSSASPDAKLNTLIDYLLNSGKGEFSCYRKIRW